MQSIKDELKAVRTDAGLTQAEFGEVLSPPGKNLQQWDVAKMEARVGSSTALPAHLEDLFYAAARLDRIIRFEVGGMTVLFSPSAIAEGDSVERSISASGLPAHDRELLAQIYTHMRERQAERHEQERGKHKPKRGRRFSVDDEAPTSTELRQADAARQSGVELLKGLKSGVLGDRCPPVESANHVPEGVES